jgi:hypothetical protein
MRREDPELGNPKVKLISEVSLWHVVASLMLFPVGRRSTNEIESGVGCVSASDGVGHDARDSAG